MPQPTRVTLPDLVITTESAAETHQLAFDLAAAARPGDLICLWGDLGAGKTVLAKGFGAGLGVVETISSPTFVLMAEYAGRMALFHLDLYRVAGAEDALAGGLLDERQASGVTIVEWPDRLGVALPIERLDIRIDGDGEEHRRIRLSAGSSDLERYLATMRSGGEAAQSRGTDSSWVPVAPRHGDAR